MHQHRRNLLYEFVRRFLAWCCHNSWVLILFSQNLIQNYFTMEFIIDYSSLEHNVQSVVQIQGVTKENTIGRQLSPTSSYELGSMTTQDTYRHMKKHNWMIMNQLCQILTRLSKIVVTMKSMKVTIHILLHPAKFPQWKSWTVKSLVRVKSPTVPLWKIFRSQVKMGMTLGTVRS